MIIIVKLFKGNRNVNFNLAIIDNSKHFYNVSLIKNLG